MLVCLYCYHSSKGLANHQGSSVCPRGEGDETPGENEGHHLSCKYLPIDFQSAFCLMIIVHDCLSQDLLRVRCENCGQALDRKRGLKVANTLTCLICGHETEVAECLSHVQSFVSLLYFMNIFSIRWRAFHWRRSAEPACSPRSSFATSWTGSRALRLHKFAR